MASKSKGKDKGIFFLDAKKRAELLREIGEDLDVVPQQQEEGCRVCGKDDDHSNLMLCERCNAEYHIYCLDPPLKAVPDDEWFCEKCKPKKIKKIDGGDDLDLMVLALPPRFTERFGEVVWANGGNGFGWWPSYIYDPRMTVGVARDLARKNLGKRHLVYFFQCYEAPFAVVPDAKIMKWGMGLLENCHLGKVARHTSKSRTMQFEEAMKVAVLELDKRIDQRMDWNHPDPTPSSPPTPVVTDEGNADDSDDADDLSRGRRTTKVYVPAPKKLFGGKKRRHIDSKDKAKCGNGKMRNVPNRTNFFRHVDSGVSSRSKDLK